MIESCLRYHTCCSSGHFTGEIQEKGERTVTERGEMRLILGAGASLDNVTWQANKKETRRHVFAKQAFQKCNKKKNDLLICAPG